MFKTEKGHKLQLLVQGIITEWNTSSRYKLSTIPDFSLSPTQRSSIV